MPALGRRGAAARHERRVRRDEVRRLDLCQHEITRDHPRLRLTRYDGFRFQLHWNSGARQLRCFYRSGVECTNDVQDLLPAARGPHAHHVDTVGPFPLVPLRQLTLSLRLTLSGSLSPAHSLRLTLSSSLSPATDQVRLAFGGDPAEVLCRSGDAATRKRYTWLEKALGRVTDAQREAFVRTDVVLDGERLVHDASTCAGHGHTTCPGKK